MPKYRLLAALLGSMTTCLAAADRAAPVVPVYVGGDAKPAGPGTLDTSDARKMRVSWQGGRWELDYGHVRVLYVSRSRPSGLPQILGLPGLLGLLRERKVYLSVRYETPEGEARTGFFGVPKDAGGPVMDLARKAGKELTFESHEARLWITGRRRP